MDIITQNENGTLSVSLSGRFTFSDNPAFRNVLEKISDPGIRQIVLHMDKVEFVDSAALGMLLLASDEAEKYKKSLVIKGVGGQVKRIFEMARFEQFFKLQ